MTATTLIAWIGAITGTSSLFWDIYKWSDERKSRLELLVERTRRIHGSGKADQYGGEASKEMELIIIHAINHSKHDIDISSVDYENDGNLQLCQPKKSVLQLYELTNS